MKITIHVTETDTRDANTGIIINSESNADMEFDMGDENVSSIVSQVINLATNKEFISGIKSMFCNCSEKKSTNDIDINTASITETKSEIGYSVNWCKRNDFETEVYDKLLAGHAHIISLNVIKNIVKNIVSWTVAYETIGGPLGKLLDECEETITDAERDAIVLTILNAGDDTGFIVNK